MRISWSIGAGLLVLGLAGCDRIVAQVKAHLPAKAEVLAKPAAMPVSSSSSASLDPHNLWDELLLNEHRLAAAEPGTFERTDKTVTILSGGKPLASFTYTYNQSQDEVAIWRYLGHINLTDKDGVTRTAYRMERGGIEWEEEVLLDPDGRLHEMGLAARITPDGRFIANGSLEVMSGENFAIIDWQQRKTYEFGVACQTTDVDQSDRFSVICQPDNAPAFAGNATRLADGRWQITATGMLKMDANSEPEALFDAEGKVVVSVKTDPLPPGGLPPIYSKPSPLKDNTAELKTWGFAWLGGNR